jgi:multiple sugar transport system permease protein
VKQFFEITIPLLSLTIFFVTITRVIGGLQVFDLIYMVMDKDNPELYCRVLNGSHGVRVR